MHYQTLTKTQKLLEIQSLIVIAALALTLIRMDGWKGGGGGGGQKGSHTSFFPVTYTNVGLSPKNFDL